MFARFLETARTVPFIYLYIYICVLAAIRVIPARFWVSDAILRYADALFCSPTDFAAFRRYSQVFQRYFTLYVITKTPHDDSPNILT